MIARLVLTLFLGIAGLVCFYNRACFEEQAMTAVYGDVARILARGSFRPGASAVEDGVRQTAVLIAGRPHFKVTSPPALWRDHHKDSVCAHDVCTAAATSKTFVKTADGFGSLLGFLVLGSIIWVMIVGTRPPGVDQRVHRFRVSGLPPVKRKPPAGNGDCRSLPGQG